LASRSFGQIDPLPLPAVEVVSVVPEALRRTASSAVDVDVDAGGAVVVGSPLGAAVGGVSGSVSTAVAAGCAGAERITGGRVAVRTAPALATTVGTLGPAEGSAVAPPVSAATGVAPGDVCPTVVLVTSTVAVRVVGAVEAGGVVVVGAVVAGGVVGGRVVGGRVVGGSVVGGRVVGGRVGGGSVAGGRVVEGAGCPSRWCADAAGAVMVATASVASSTRGATAIRSLGRLSLRGVAVT
jgi:hypothetical protein